ncbi:MAG TPA: hypothetical protein VHR45_15670 [Thermoanaerobaculia bacterium]|nr:hypothetical protein [Thermoanaerobaculia bacterium]
MMGRALLLLGLLATLGLIAAAAMGYGVSGSFGRQLGSGADLLRGHVLVGLGACLVLLFSHCWILLYLLATGRVVAGLVRENGLEAEIAARSGRLRLRALPWLALALMAALATFLLGSIAFAGSAPVGVHHALFYATLAAQGRALWIESRVLRDNHRLLADLGQRLQGHAA